MENIALLKERWFKKEVERLGHNHVSKADIARALDIKPQYLNSVLNGSRGITDSFLDRFIEIYQINQFDLCNIESSHSDSTITMRFMDKLDSKEEIIKEKDLKIEELTLKIMEMSEQIGNLKAQIAQQQGDDIEHNESNIAEAFTSPSSEDYGGSSLPMTKTTPRDFLKGKV
jgi:hypothetical protein